MRRSAFTRFGAAALVAAGAAAVAVPAGAAQSAAGSNARAAAPALTDAMIVGIDSVFRDMDRTSTPGCAVGVVLDGALAFADGYGSANLDHELPITPHTVFYMGSVSKQFTAAAVALAARQGHLSLDDDVRRWFPELPDYGDTVRVRHLVHHTSGIRDYLTLQGIAGGFGGTTDQEVIDLLARQRALNFAPGERELYSNSGYFLMAELVERATGRSLREYAQEHFFAPLGMRSSHFHDDADHVVRHRATGYAPAGSGADGGSDAGAGGARDDFRMNHAWSFAQVGSGGLYSNVEDMARWEAAFEEGSIGPPGFRDSLLQRGVLNDGDTLTYAFGVDLREYRGLPMIGHTGSLAGFRSAMVRFPEQRAAVLVFCNVTNANPNDRAMEVVHRVLADELGPDTQPPSVASGPEEAGDADAPRPPGYAPAELSEFAGVYDSPEVDVRMRVVVEGGELLLERPGGQRSLEAVAADRFGAGPWTLRFQRDGSGRVTAFLLDAGRANGIVFERVEERGG